MRNVSDSSKGDGRGEDDEDDEADAARLPPHDDASPVKAPARRVASYAARRREHESISYAATTRTKASTAVSSFAMSG